MSKIAVLGTGLLGAGFAQNLLKLGHEVVVWNRTASKTDALVALGATAADTPAQAVAGAERVHLILTSDDAVESVIEAARPGLTDGTWVIDHSTNAPARVAQRHPALRAQGVRYVHAPVFMAPSNARDASGLMLIAATDDEVRALRPALETMTGGLWHVGTRPDVAAVQKIMGNGALVSVASLMGDLFSIARNQGLEPSDVMALFDAFKLGAIFPRTGQRVLDAATMDASFELSMARKDVGLMIDAAGDLPLTVLPGVAAAFDAGIAKGQGAMDFAIAGWPGRPVGS